MEMTFPAELERLLKEATEGPWIAVHEIVSSAIKTEQNGFTDVPVEVAESFSVMHKADTQIIALLRNHADAILGLVRAAECIRHWHDSGKDGMVVSAEHVRNLWEALAKLNGGKG